ncbi:MAG: hybrid sensor histidine kinase/response regulator [Pleurocapsa minor GSE-CHR-MK-17-07R]|jgi:signal transduction histidine kinase|nr:hybrid sensor histidine kinase/response regulator [Pleurocapsa minor GSE-CHR-MK 17-07R]
MTEQSAPYTILYIEDDPGSRMLVERTLHFAGFRVLTAERGLQGIDMARMELPDLILTDINLPDIGGREIATTLRADPRFASTPIVALTAQVMTGQREMSMVAGITGFLLKPLDVEHLPNQLHFYLGGGQDKIESDLLGQAQKNYTQEVAVRLETRIRELEKFNEDLRHLDNVKDAFINITAHELRTPLTLLIGYNRLLMENPAIRTVLAQDDGSRLLVEGMSQAITRMQAIINEILTTSRIINNRLELSISPVNITEVIQRAVGFYQQAIKDRRMNITLALAGAPSRMLADWDLTELVMRNLIGNAIKFTPDNGTITVTVTPLVGTGPEDTNIRISVKDTGIGIPRDAVDRIFERFNTTNDHMLHSTSKTAFRGGGIGLGLAVCKGVVEAHGGSISAVSPGFDPERLPGSEFIVVLPLMAGGKRSVRSIMDNGNSPQGRG